MLKYILRGASAEALKIKRSLAVIAALVIPIFPAFINFADTWQTGIRPEVEGVTDPWSIYLMFSIKFWAIFAMPMTVAILSALLANVDHKTKEWKLLFTLPFPRGAVFASKWLALAGITCLSTLVFCTSNVIGGALLHFIRPDTRLYLPIPLAEAFARPMLGWLLSLFMISIHLWISLRWSSFLVSIIVGFAGTVSNLFLISSYLFYNSFVSPWAMPAQAYAAWQPTLVGSLVGAALVYFLAQREFVRRDIL